MANNIITNVEGYKRLLEVAIKEIDNYIEHPTKASSLRIRKHSTFIGKDGSHLRAALIAHDKSTVNT